MTSFRCKGCGEVKEVDGDPPGSGICLDCAINECLSRTDLVRDHLTCSYCNPDGRRLIMRD